MFKKNFISEYLSNEELEKISSLIAEIESKTSGELRLSIKRKRGYLEKEFTPRELAIKEFFNLRMNETLDKTGVLFFILVEERSYEIIADEGVNVLMSDEKWNELTGDVTFHFSQKKYSAGIQNLLKKIGEILIKEFPVKEGDVNELPNDVIIG